MIEALTDNALVRYGVFIFLFLYGWLTGNWILLFWVICAVAEELISYMFPFLVDEWWYKSLYIVLIVAGVFIVLSIFIDVMNSMFDGAQRLLEKLR